MLTLCVAQRRHLWLQCREGIAERIDVAPQGGRRVGGGTAGCGLELGQLLVLVVRFGSQHGGAQAQGADHQGLKVVDLHGAISSVEKGGLDCGERRA
ncbi:hypothetical protein D3C71_1575420 [compost metagenome]